MAQVSNREELVKGAIECLQTKGYARTTARDIAASSGANLASIGYHFGSKDALLDEALIRICVERTAHLGEITLSAETASPLERLTTAFEAVQELFDEHRPLLVAFVEAMAQVERSEHLRTRLASHYRDARRAVAEYTRASLGPAAGHMRTDPQVFASFLIAVFDGLVLQWLLDSNDVPPGNELVASMVETLALSAETTATSRKPQGTKTRRRSPSRR